MRKSILILLAIFCSAMAAYSQNAIENLVPQPRQAYTRYIYSGIFSLDAGERIYLFEEAQGRAAAEYLNERLRQLEVDTLEFITISSPDDVDNGVVISTPMFHVNRMFAETPDQKIEVTADYPGPGGYVADIMPGRVILAGSDVAGTFNAVNTFLQLLKHSQNNNMVFPARVVDAPVWRERWQIAETDITNDDDFAGLKDMISNSSFFKINKIVLDDKNLGKIPLMPESYRNRLIEIADMAKAYGIRIVPVTMPWGNSSSALARDPDYAAGLPVLGQRFVVDGDIARVVPQTHTSPENGSFEHFAKTGQSYDFPGFDEVSGTPDTLSASSGSVSLRFEQTPMGTLGFSYTTPVTPFTQYRLSFKYRANTNNPNGVHAFIYISGTPLASEPDYRKLIHFQSVGMADTDEWQSVDVLFNPLERETAYVHLFVTPQNDTAWIDDFTIEETAFVNLIRRDGAPLHVSHTIKDILYEEGLDYKRLEDALLGRADGIAGNYENYHTPPDFEIMPEGNFVDGDSLVISYFHAFPYPENNVTMTMGLESAYDLMAQVSADINAIFQPDEHYLKHTLPSAMNYDLGDKDRNLTPTELFEYNVSESRRLIDQQTPGAMVWDHSFMYVDDLEMRDYHLMYVDGEFERPDGIQRKPGLLNYNADSFENLIEYHNLGERGYDQLLPEVTTVYAIDCLFGTGEYCAYINKVRGFFRRPGTGRQQTYADFAWNHPPYLYHYPPVIKAFTQLDTLGLQLRIKGHPQLSDFEVQGATVLYRFAENMRFTAISLEVSEEGYATARIPLQEGATGIQYYFHGVSNRYWQTRIPLGEDHYFELGEMPVSVGNSINYNDLSILKIYPSPAAESDFVTAEWFSPAGGSAEVRITDMLGRRVYEKSIISNAGINRTEIDISAQYSGIYILIITQNGRITTGKILL
ncbi:MAG: T9SS type A sorting domain-containing protein [Candidatus Kapaibacterium sp.]